MFWDTLCYRYVKDGRPITEFVEIIAVDSADSQGVFDALLTGLKLFGMSEADIKDKIMACTFDGASVNQGTKSGVIKRLRDLLMHVLVDVWCSSHKLELALMDAIKLTAFILTVVDDGVKPIYNFYYASGKRRRDVNAISEVLDEDPVYFSAPTGARWMASRLRAYKAVIKHYNSVVMHLEDASNRKTDEVSKCVGYLKTLLSVKFVEGLHFMVDVLEILASVSLAFQKNDIFITDLTVKLSEAAIRLEALKHEPGEYHSHFKSTFTMQGRRFNNKGHGHIIILNS